MTAGKSFILGYTNEQEGIFEAPLPVIIFDDFTTSTKLVNFPFKVKSSAMKILKKSEKISADIRFVFFMMQKLEINNDTHKRYWLNVVSHIKIPLPPLEIQREIVEILESKLEKNKEAKALLETSLQECETYRLSLLESAFSGNLTPHSQNWQWVKLGEICDTSSGGTPSRTQLSYWNGEIKWLKSGELNDGLIDNVGETITQEGLKHSSAKLLPKGTLLIAMYGATIGRLGILNIETSTNQAICAITPKEENMLDTKFLFYFLFASRPKMLQDSFGGAQKNISQAYLKQFSIPLPPLEIQREIVEILESKLEKIKEAKALLETSLQECETYRLSLLESAFAGELV